MSKLKNTNVIFVKYITLKNGSKLYAWQRGKKCFVIPKDSLSYKKKRGN